MKEPINLNEYFRAHPISDKEFKKLAKQSKQDVQQKMTNYMADL